MSDPTMKRLQQGIFEGLASQNRVVGSGGGSGVGIMQPFGTPAHGGNAVGNPGKNYTATGGYAVVADTGAPVVSCSITFITARTAPYLVLGNISVLGPTAGNGNSQFTVYLDAAVANNTPLLYSGVPLAGIQPQITTVPVLYVSDPLTAGSHTIDVRIQVPAATTYQVQSFDLYAFQLGF